MNKNDIVFDIETKQSFQEVGGASNMDKLGISVLGHTFMPMKNIAPLKSQRFPNLKKLSATLLTKKMDG